MHAAQGFDDILERLGQAVAETRSMARTIGYARVPRRDGLVRHRRAVESARTGSVSLGMTESLRLQLIREAA